MFDFNDATAESGSKYLEPGIHEVMVSEIKSGESSQKKTPYVEITVKDSTGASCSQQYYLSTVPGASGISAWQISRNAILQLVMAATNSDEITAKGKMPKAANAEELATKLSTMLVGKKFAIQLNGKWVNPTDTAKKPWVKAEFGNYTFAVSLDKKHTLRFDSSKNIKGSAAPSATELANDIPGLNGVPVKADW
jgi:hypothetical protein